MKSCLAIKEILTFYLALSRVSSMLRLYELARYLNFKQSTEITFWFVTVQ